MVDQVKGRSPKRLKSLRKVSNVAHVTVQALSLNLNLVFSPYSVPRPSYTFFKCLGDQVKGRSQKELKSLIVVPYVALLNVQALSFNVNLFPFP